MLQVKPDKPLSPALSPVLLALMYALDNSATALNAPYFVIGATARDILLEHVYGLETTRATRDVDFAVAVSSWDEFNELKTRLIATGAFMPGEAAQRLMFGDGPAAYPLDLVPFDGVEHHGQIAWPPDGDFVMNIAGYADALASALSIEVAPGFIVKVVSLPAMTVLKILAWKDRPDRDKHASDVVLILRCYHEAGQFDRLYGEATDLLATYDYDIELAGTALLARDALRDIAPETCQQVRDLLADDRRAEKFIAQAGRSSPVTNARATLLVHAFLQALHG